MSGAPYIIELIERSLLHDLKVFSIAALCVLGLSALAISRSVVMVLGTLIACANASALTLVLTQTFGIPIGPLTANLSTIVFVLTLTHMVFMTFNWKHIIEKREMDAEKAWWRAVRGRCFPHFGACSRRSLAFSALCRCRRPRCASSGSPGR